MFNGKLFTRDVAFRTAWYNGGYLGINRDTSETSNFAVAEVLVWSRALSSSDLWQVSSALAAKYCLCVPAQRISRPACAC